MVTGVSHRSRVATARSISDRRDSRSLISLVFSFWNEEETLPELTRRVTVVMERLIEQRLIGDYELIFVNDASTDRSEEILIELAETYRSIKVISMSRNFGVSPCVLAGMAHARGDAVIYMDADLQDPPETIPELIGCWQVDHETEVVHTVRRSRAGESWIKKLVTKVGYRVLRAVSTIDLPLQAGDFKLLSRRAVDQVLQFREKRPFLRGLVCWIGFEQRVVYYHREPRAAGKTKFPVLGWKVLRNFIDSAIVSFSDVPLKLSTALGLVCSLAALAAMGWVAIAWRLGGAIPGWTAAMIVALFLGGVQLLSIGILGNYIGSIFLETKSRPNYIIKETRGFDPPPPIREREDRLPAAIRS